jgi:hypothetical protein
MNVVRRGQKFVRHGGQKFVHLKSGTASPNSILVGNILVDRQNYC